MGPKKKGKPPPPAKKPKEKPNPKEVVTELMKQVFEIQLADIRKKLERLALREEELKLGKVDFDKKTEVCRKENGLIIEEKEKLLAAKEEEKIAKREDMLWHANEIKNRIRAHEKHILELQKKYSELLAALAERLKDLEEQVRVLDDFKQNKEGAKKVLLDLENELEETEMQHQRNLFEIHTKSEMAKVRVKKELEARLLQLSIEFQEMSQKRIGKSCHRLSQENKAISNELRFMEADLLHFEESYKEAVQNIKIYKAEQKDKETEKKKRIARILVLKHLTKIVAKDRLELTERLKEYYAVDNTNKALLKRLKSIMIDIEKKVTKIEEIKRQIEEKEDEKAQLNETSLKLKHALKKLIFLARNSLKLAEEASAVRLIPLGGLEEETNMTIEAKTRLFRQRREKVFKRKGRIMEHLFENVCKAQMSDDEKKLISTPSDVLKVDYSQINFNNLQGKGLSEEELKDVLALTEEEKSLVSRSDVSLPRSISEENVKGSQGEEEENAETETEAGELELDSSSTPLVHTSSEKTKPSDSELKQQKSKSHEKPSSRLDHHKKDQGNEKGKSTEVIKKDHSKTKKNEEENKKDNER